MKTRKEAEARAMELFPKKPVGLKADINGNYTDNSEVIYSGEVSRKAFIQCWEEMQKAELEERMKDVPDKYRNMPVEFVNKQTCGFCVEPKNEVKEKLPQRQDSLAEQLRDLRLVANKLGMYDAADYIRETTIQDNGLREAAEKVDERVGKCDSCGDTKNIVLQVIPNSDNKVCYDCWKGKTTIQDNGLREAAEKVVYEWHNSVGEECIDAAMVKLVKVLNSKKH
jgi:hypothetical protein